MADTGPAPTDDPQRDAGRSPGQVTERDDPEAPEPDGPDGSDAQAEGWKSPESKDAAMRDLQAARQQARELAAWKAEREAADQEAAREAMSEAEKAREDARAEGLAIGYTALRRAAVMVAATSPDTPFHDPAQAAALLGPALDTVSVSEDGQVDQSQVDALVAELAERSPHLVRGPSGVTPGPADLNGDGGVTPPGEPRDADSWNASLRRTFARG